MAGRVGEEERRTGGSNEERRGPAVDGKKEWEVKRVIVGATGGEAKCSDVEKSKAHVRCAKR